MAETRYYGTGKRKNAIAKVWLTSGEGNISVNEKTLMEYFCRRTLEALILQPFEATDTVGRYSVVSKTLGGGISGQAGALRHGISKALVEADPELRTVLRRGRLPDPRSARQGKQEVRSQARAPWLPVLQALSSEERGRISPALFSGCEGAYRDR